MAPAPREPPNGQSTLDPQLRALRKAQFQDLLRATVNLIVKLPDEDFEGLEEILGSGRERDASYRNLLDEIGRRRDQDKGEMARKKEMEMEKSLQEKGVKGKGKAFKGTFGRDRVAGERVGRK